MTIVFLINKIRVKLTKLKAWVGHVVCLGYHCLANRTVQQQLKNYKCIPIIIISFNQLYYLKQQVDFLLKQGYTNLVILDNNSTYAPLLAYFKSIETSVVVIRLNENLGHLAFWKTEAVFKRYSKGYYVVSDADIVPIGSCPDDFLHSFRQLLDKAYDRTKVGFSLHLEDLPENNPNKAAILKWEAQFWNRKIHPMAYKADIDTTFALYRPSYKYQLKDFTKAWRTDYPLQARHGGWYVDVKHLTEEQAYYMQTANDSASWQINEQGELINETHKPLYGNE